MSNMAMEDERPIGVRSGVNSRARLREGMKIGTTSREDSVLELEAEERSTIKLGHVWICGRECQTGFSN